MKTIHVTIDPRLLKALDQLTLQRKTTRSALICAALEAELRRVRVNELETHQIAGYSKQPAAPSDLDLWIHEQVWGI